MCLDGVISFFVRGFTIWNNFNNIRQVENTADTKLFIREIFAKSTKLRLPGEQVHGREPLRPTDERQQTFVRVRRGSTILCTK